MLELRKGTDILAEVGRVRTMDEARKVFAASLDASNAAKISEGIHR